MTNVYNTNLMHKSWGLLRKTLAQKNKIICNQHSPECYLCKRGSLRFIVMTQRKRIDRLNGKSLGPSKTRQSKSYKRVVDVSSREMCITSFPSWPHSEYQLLQMWERRRPCLLRGNKMVAALPWPLSLPWHTVRQTLSNVWTRITLSFLILPNRLPATSFCTQKTEWVLL